MENVNATVQKFLRTADPELKHLIAQKDIPFFNSKIENFNKIINHEFLLPRNLEHQKQLINALAEDVPTYNTIRPQYSLYGNTPAETFAGKPLDISHFKTHFDNQKNKSNPKHTKWMLPMQMMLKKQNLIQDNSSIRFLFFEQFLGMLLYFKIKHYLSSARFFLVLT